jgi:hypothetical protein
VKFFIQAGLCGNSAAEVAVFFRQTPGLDRTKIGEYFGERYSAFFLFLPFDLLSDLFFGFKLDEKQCC